MGARVELDGVHVRFGEVHAVRGVDLQIDEGEFLALLGTSGSGKSTTLKCINRLVSLSAGQVRIDGGDLGTADVLSLRRRIGYVLQSIALFPNLSVGENVAVVPQLLGWSTEEVDARVHELLALMGLSPADYVHRRTHELSGGQAQRVGVARALAGRPDVLLLDEPFGALDPVTRARLQGEVRELHDRLGLTSVLVTHDVVEAVRMADRIAVMDQGVILQVATPKQLLAHPEPGYVTELLNAALGPVRDRMGGTV